MMVPIRCPPIGLNDICLKVCSISDQLQWALVHSSLSSPVLLLSKAGIRTRRLFSHSINMKIKCKNPNRMIIHMSFPLNNEFSFSGDYCRYFIM